MAKLSLIILMSLISISMYATPIMSNRGNMCTGSGPEEFSCQTSKTNLYCYEGRCKCPEGLTMPSLDIPSSLNTFWHGPKNKCLAVRGAQCDTRSGRNKLDCLPGLKCKAESKNSSKGMCA